MDRSPEPDLRSFEGVRGADAGSGRPFEGARGRIGQGTVVGGLVALVVAMVGFAAVLLRFSFDALGDRIDDTNAAVVANGERITRLEERVESRFERVEARLGRVEARLGRVEGRLDRVEGRLVELDERIDEVAENVVRILTVLEARAEADGESTPARDGVRAEAYADSDEPLSR